MTKLGQIGIWSGQLRRSDRAGAIAASVELERLGFGALWMPGGGNDVFERVGDLLGATSSIIVATGIISIWMHEAAIVARACYQLEQAFPGRFLLGIGVSHAEVVDQAAPGRYKRPVQSMSTYLDLLEAAPIPVSSHDRVLAALGPRMLALAKSRADGAHPYFVPTSHTRRARKILGPGPLLAPEQAVVLEDNSQRALAIARAHVSRGLRRPNYANNLVREGFTTSDFEGGGSDRLVDRIVALGPLGAATRVEEHLQAGADHVCIQVLIDHEDQLPIMEWARLASALALNSSRLAD